MSSLVVAVLLGIVTLIGCDDYDFNMPVTPFLLLDSYEVNFGQNSDKRTIEVRCNEEWTVELSKELQGWCNVNRNEDDDLVVSVTLSEDKYVRRGEFYVKALSQTDTVHVAQLGYEQSILVSPQSMNIDAAGDRVMVEVTSNVNYVITSSEWITEEVQPGSRAPQETVTKQHFFKIEGNKGDRRIGEIVFADSDEMSELEPTVINVIQKGVDTYEPIAPQEGNDIQVFPNSAEGDGGVPNENTYYKTFDNDLTNEWQANWRPPLGLVYPQYIEYTFDEPVDLDYIIYHCKYHDNRFKDVKIEVLTDVTKSRSTEYVTVYDGVFDDANSTRADFNASQSNVSKVKFTISTCYNMGKPLRCHEIQFFQKDPNAFKYDDLFTDIACTELKPGITEDDILNCNNSFYKTLAWFLYNGKYQREFRIANYKAYPHPSIDATANKTAKYSLLDNPTGIFVSAGENLVVMADLKGLDKVNIRVQNLDQPGKDGFGGTEYTLINGTNTINIKEKGLVYVMYHKDDYQTAPEITLHFASGKVNGYYDTQKHEKGRWKQLLADAVDTHFDVLGQYAHMTFPTAAFLNYTKDVDKLVESYDEMAYRQQEFLGLVKYDKMFHNRSYFNVHYNSDSYLYATDYHTAYIDYSLKELANEELLPANIWGLAHELGHVNQVRPGLKWLGTTEVTNNIMALYVQTVVFGQPSRLQTQQIDDFSSRYSKAWTYCVPNKMAHNLFDQGDSKADVFCKLVPFWQLQLYYGKIKGNTPKEQQDHGGFYPDLYERVRTTADPSTDGKCQLEFVYNCCELAKADLIDFFTAWGFLTPIKATIHDYSDKEFTITESEIDELKNRIKALGYSKPGVALEYLTDDNTDIYKNQSALVKGTAARDGKTFTMNGWQNAVAFVVADVAGNHIYVTEGNVRTFDMLTDWQSGYKLYAVSVTGELTDTGVK